MLVAIELDLRRSFLKKKPCLVEIYALETLTGLHIDPRMHFAHLRVISPCPLLETSAGTDVVVATVLVLSELDI